MLGGLLFLTAKPEVRGVPSWFSYIRLMFDSNWAVLGMSLVSFDFSVPQTETDLTFGVFWGPFPIRKNG